MKIIKEKSLFRTQGKISYFPRIGDLSFPSDDRFLLCSTFSRGRFSLFILSPGLRSYLTYPGLLMYVPVRDKKNPRQIRSNAPQTRSVKPLNGEVINLLKRSASNSPQAIKPFKHKGSNGFRLRSSPTVTAIPPGAGDLY